MNTTHQKAFTLVEMLVAILVISILIGLLLPAVQAAREVARNTQCSFNLKQMGLALHSYHAVNSMFPPSWMYTDGSVGSSNQMSGFVFMLPFMEQQPIYNAINMDFASYESAEHPLVENRTARTSTVATYICPSEIGAINQCSYRFNHGCHVIGRTPPFDGPFSIGVLPSDTTISDGLSQTAVMSERRTGSGAGIVGNPRRDIKVVAWPTDTYPGDPSYIDFCLNDQTDTWFTGTGRYWMYCGMNYTHYNHNGTPNDTRPSCGITTAGLYPPRSYHPGKVNVLFGDGHTEAVSDTIQSQVWRAFGTHAGRD